MKLCRLFQWWWSFRSESGKRPSAWWMAHPGRCDDCRRWVEAQQQVVRHLKDPQGRQDRVPSPDLPGRITTSIRSLETEGDETLRTASGPLATLDLPWSRAQLAMVAVGLCLMSLLVWRVVFTPGAVTSPGIIDRVVEQATLDLIQAAPFEDGIAVTDMAEQMSQSFETEMELVKQDVQQTLASLENQFLPRNSLTNFVLAVGGRR